MKNKMILTDFDLGFAKYIQKSSKMSETEAFVLFVNAIAKGNGDYIKYLCSSCGHPKDMLKTIKVLLSLK